MLPTDVTYFYALLLVVIFLDEVDCLLDLSEYQITVTVVSLGALVST